MSAATIPPQASIPPQATVPPHDSTRRQSIAGIQTASRWRGVVAGLTAAGTGLAIGELVSGLFRDLTSPVIGVGNRVVDLVPVPVKNFAISTFGTKDKLALLIGIGLTIAVAAMVFGALAVRRRWIGLVGIAAFGVVGAIAATTGLTGTLADAIPSLVAAVVGSAVLFVLLPTRRELTDEEIVRAIVRPASEPAAPSVARSELTLTTAGLSRRNFVGLAAGFAGAAAVAGIVGRRLQSSASVVAARAKLLLPSAKKPLPAIPATAQVDELAIANPFITPNKDFYRIDTALVVPRVDVDTWTLTIDGMVGKPLSFTYEDLLSRELVERDITLTCVSNEVGGILMGNARWLGIPLRDLLGEAGVDAAASQIVGHSVDGWTSGFPTAVLEAGSEAFLALGMNGEPLPFEHGFPARLVVPGLYGYVSATKWLTRIELTTLDAFDAYWVPRGYAKEAPIKMASRIDVPRGLSTIPAGRTAIAGVAWAQTVGIAKVEIQIDGGDWQEAELADEQSIDTWRQWRFAWDATTGQHDIAVRATDRNGNLQTEERVAPLPNGATGWHQVLAFVS
jgi:DMSO/TMAO reductase YedYZ molybdopterin-dependent catalytic subunit